MVKKKDSSYQTAVCNISDFIMDKKLSKLNHTTRVHLAAEIMNRFYKNDEKRIIFLNELIGTNIYKKENKDLRLEVERLRERLSWISGLTTGGIAPSLVKRCEEALKKNG